MLRGLKGRMEKATNLWHITISNHDIFICGKLVMCRNLKTSVGLDGGMSGFQINLVHV